MLKKYSDTYYKWIKLRDPNLVTARNYFSNGSDFENNIVLSQEIVVLDLFPSIFV